MNWVIAGSYGVLLWMLPVAKWKYRRSDYTAILLAIPFAVLQAWLVGNTSLWTLFPVYLLWRIVRLAGVEEEKGIDWIGTLFIVLGLGVMVFLYFHEQHGVPAPQLPWLK